MVYILNKFWKKYATTENILIGCVLVPAGLLGFAFILEYFVDLVPCPLCIVQRFFFFFIGLVALGGLVWKSVFTVQRSGLLISFLAFLGGSIALRQVILQHQPMDMESTGCAVSFGSFMDSFLYALGGRGNCGVVDWTFLQLSIAEWSFLCFVGFLIVGIWLINKHEGKV